jgi:chromosomal replication initiation ATPase DnaA
VYQEVATRIPDHFVRQMLEQAVPRVFMVASTELWSQTRGRPSAAFARQVGMYLAHVTCGLSLTEVGEVFARDRTTVAHACSRVEDERDDAGFDRALELLEGIMRAQLPPTAAAPQRSRPVA